MTAFPFTIGRWTFPSKAAFIARCRAILHGGDIDTEIRGTDAELVETVFRRRADKLKVCGSRRVVAFHRRKHPSYPTPCFHAELDDGTMLHFSFQKALWP